MTPSGVSGAAQKLLRCRPGCSGAAPELPRSCPGAAPGLLRCCSGEEAAPELLWGYF